MMKKILNPLFALCLFSPTYLLAQTAHLVFAVDLIRHGDRTALRDLPYALYNWPEGKGQLTALGMQQEYQLGLSFNQRYRVENELLPNNYQAGLIYIRSTDYDRTLMSAQSLLMGLYPLGSGPSLPDAGAALPANFQPIPIHTVPVTKEDPFSIDSHASKFAELAEQFVFTRDDWKKKSAELSPYYAEWHKLTGMPVDNWIDVVRLGDTLRTYILHDLALPAGLSRAEADKIIAANDWFYATLFKPREIGDYVGGPALKKIKQFIKEAVAHQSELKWVLLSAHDDTMLAVRSALHIPLDAPPPYASNLNFLLYQTESGAYFIRVRYNNQPLKIPACAMDCELSQFMRH